MAKRISIRKKKEKKEKKKEKKRKKKEKKGKKKFISKTDPKLRKFGSGCSKSCIKRKERKASS